MIKKNGILIFLFLFSFIGYTQNFESCKEAKKQASLDFKKGISLLSFQYIFDPLNKGAFYKTEEKYQKFYQNYLLTNYNINFDYSCFSSFEFDYFEYQDCYKKVYKKLFLKKNGKLFLPKFKTEVDVAYQKFKTSKKNSLSLFLDFNKIYTYTDSQPKFNGDDQILKDFLIKFNNIKTKYDITIEFTIDRKGKVEECILKYQNKSVRIKKNILREINKLGVWIPAYLYFNKIKSIYIIRPFEFLF